MLLNGNCQKGFTVKKTKLDLRIEEAKIEDYENQADNLPLECIICDDPWCHGCPSDEEFEAERDAAHKLNRY